MQQDVWVDQDLTYPKKKKDMREFHNKCQHWKQDETKRNNICIVNASKEQKKTKRCTIVEGLSLVNESTLISTIHRRNSSTSRVPL